MLCRLLVPSVAPMRLKSEPNNQETAKWDIPFWQR